MNEDGRLILANLRAVDDERRRRAAAPPFGAKVWEVKRYQHGRFAHTYADLLAQPDYAAAARFFLDELYGPHDFTDRDAQFARIVPGLVRLFPAELVKTVVILSELHALSERLDSRMGDIIDARPLDGDRYAQAWRAVGEPGSRGRQIDLTVRIGAALERYTHSALVRRLMHLMRGPAQALGIAALHRFLEAGFETFGGMRDSRAFLDIVAGRERALAQALFAGGAAPDVDPRHAVADTRTV